jgi:hypothetical protein
MPVSLYRPGAYNADDIIPVHELSHLGATQSGGSETPETVQIFFKTITIDCELCNLSSQTMLFLLISLKQNLQNPCHDHFYFPK